MHKKVLVLCAYLGMYISPVQSASTDDHAIGLWDAADQLYAHKEPILHAYRAYLFLRVAWMYHLATADRDYIIDESNHWTAADFFRRAQGSLLETTSLLIVLQECKKFSLLQPFLDTLEQFYHASTTKQSFERVFNYFREQTSEIHIKLIQQLTAQEEALCIEEVHDALYPPVHIHQMKGQLYR